MKKITRATVKSFIRRHRDHLFIRVDSQLDGNDDCKRPIHGATFERAKVSYLREEITGEFADEFKGELLYELTLGVEGASFSGGRRDAYSAYQRDGYEGIEVFNHMRSFVLAVRSEVFSAEKLAAKLPRASAAPSRSRL